MSVNSSFDDLMKAGVTNLVDNSKYDKVTNHVTFDADKVELPKGITQESIKSHVGFINDLSSQTEVAVSQIAQEQFKDNKDLTTVDGTLSFDGFVINSQHHLKTQVGDDFIYGNGTTAIDYQHSEEQAVWLETQRNASAEAAKKLFS